MSNIELTQQQYDKMLEIDEDYKDFPFDVLQFMIQKGADKVSENKGFANLDTTSTEEEMICIGAFIEWRQAKQLLGEFVQEIDD